MLVWCMLVEHVVSMQDCGMRGCAGEDDKCPLSTCQTVTDLMHKLKEADINVEHFGSFDSDPLTQLKTIKVCSFI